MARSWNAVSSASVARICAVALLLCCSGPASNAQEAGRSVKIGVLAKRGAERCLEKWGPTADYLTSEIPDYSFEVVPLGYDKVYPSVERAEVDLILSNPAQYVGMERFYGTSRIVTLQNLPTGGPATVYGGVIFCRTDRQDIETLRDLRGKRFMAADEQSLGGWYAVWLELKENGINPSRYFAELQFGDTHDAIVYAVRDGKVDAGSVRTDTLERMDLEGKIRLEDFRVIHQHEHDAAYPDFVHSTRLYPEWPLAKLRHTPDELAEKIAVALMRMQPESPAARAARCAGWTIPHNYQSVHECLKALRAGPYKGYGRISLREAIGQHQRWVLGAGAIVILLLLLLVARVGSLNQMLRQAVAGQKRELTERQQAEERIAHLNAVLHAIRNVNQLITHERDRDRLLQGACAALIETRGYFSAWIALLDEDGGLVSAFEAGLGDEAFAPLREAMERNELPQCAQRALRESGIVVVEDVSATCGDCSLAGTHADTAGAAVRLEHEGRVYGLLSVSVPRHMAESEDERSLFEEVAGDIAFGLHATEAEAERERAQEALREREADQRALISSLPHKVFRKDTNSVYVFANEAFAADLGVTPDELAGKTDYDFFPRELADKYRADDKRLMESGQPETLEERYVQDGEETFVQTLKTPVRDEEGNVIGIMGIFWDITERRQAEAEVKEGRERTARIIDAAEALILGVDTEGRITLFNRKCEELTGRSAEEAIGQKIADLAPGEDWLPPAADTFTLLRAGDSLVQFDYRLPDRGGRERVITWRPAAITAEDGTLSEVVVIGIDVTERRAAEERFRGVFEQSPIGMAMTDDQRRIVSANRTFLKQFGLASAEALHGVDAREFLHCPAEGDRSVERGETLSYETSFNFSQAPYASERSGIAEMAIAIAPLVMGDCVTGCIIHVQDVTERKLSQEALIESEQRHRTLVETMGDGLTMVDREGVLTYANDAFSTMLEHKPEDLIGRHLTDLCDAENRAILEAELAKRFDEGVESEYELFYTAKSGRQVPTVVTATPLRDADGEMTGSFAVIKDVTERKEAEEALRASLEERTRAQEQLRESEATTAAMLEAIGDHMSMMDKDLTILWANGVAEAAFGDDIVGRKCYEVYHNRRTPCDPCLTLKTFKDGKIHRHETEVVTPDGSTMHYACVASVALRDGHGNPLTVIEVSRDITEHKQLEEQLRQAQKMEAVGQLAGGIAHDFNNMLTVIVGNAAVLLETMGDDRRSRRRASDILKAADQAASVTRQLLAFGRKQAMEPKVLNLNEVVAGMEPMLDRLIEDNIELITHLDPKLGQVEADPVQVEQVIVNLVVNARDAMPEGGKLTIETANVTLDEGYLAQHPDAEAGPHVMLAVSDTGRGMDEETQARIFEPFFTTKEDGKGTGLGLSTVYGIAKQSGGNIHVYSEPGVGTTFKVYLPRVEKEAAPMPEDTATDEALKGWETILLVEDEELVRELMVEVLEGRGYELLAAANGAEALAICEQYEGRIDLMVTDVVMPGMSGVELAAQARQVKPDMEVLYLSGYTNSALVDRRALGAEGHFLEKPFEPDDLARKMREILDAPQQPQE